MEVPSLRTLVLVQNKPFGVKPNIGGLLHHSFTEIRLLEVANMANCIGFLQAKHNMVVG